MKNIVAGFEIVSEKVKAVSISFIQKSEIEPDVNKSDLIIKEHIYYAMSMDL